ncbi:hypothetical protein HHK36_016167 [Tetracentron sinense]|uniref:RanBD1 domain-containing protein n=1 Tax=Tetracentron sinense TaxID=13715 RepID=A0A834Z291_TETSI|nr:hypothetical protein HHK36_016166 [Tetracentron sinense]KAF8397257.1 hypothetical protein HHK36_016167 [Tetracentron sinense]
MADLERREDEEAAAAGEDEDTGAQVAPIVKLEEVSVTTGEEEEDAILDLKAKLYRFDKEGNQWKERVLPTISVQEHAGNDKSCVWHATDFAEGELKDELFCIRFGSVENCKTFIEMVQEVAESQGKKEENKDATAAAGLLEKLSVGDSKTEEKVTEEVPVVVSEEEKEAGSEQEKPEAEKKDEHVSSVDDA